MVPQSLNIYLQALYRKVGQPSFWRGREVNQRESVVVHGTYITSTLPVTATESKTDKWF